MKLYMFRTVRLSIIRNLLTVHSAMVYVIQVCRQAFEQDQAGTARGGVVVKALHYKPAGLWFDSRWCHWNFSVT
jgi:hypothetical protein